MRHQTKHLRVYHFSTLFNVLVILSMVSQLLLPVVAQAAAPKLPTRPDYKTNLLAVSNILQQDDNGNLYFPYPEQRPGSAKGMVIQAYGNQLLPLVASFDHPSLPVELPMIAGQSSRTGNQANFALPILPNVIMANAPPSLFPLQTKIATNSIYLPMVTGGQDVSSVVGTKAIFALLLPHADILATELGFSAQQITKIQNVIDTELTTIIDFVKSSFEYIRLPSILRSRTFLSILSRFASSIVGKKTELCSISLVIT